MRQIADAMIAAHENGIDLQLSPEELGRVKLSITPGEGGFLVTVSADRPETLELLRRHIDLLGEEFAALGLGDTAFSFNDPTGHPAQDCLHPRLQQHAIILICQFVQNIEDHRFRVDLSQNCRRLPHGNRPAANRFL